MLAFVLFCFFVFCFFLIIMVIVIKQRWFFILLLFFSQGQGLSLNDPVSVNNNLERLQNGD